MDKISPDTLYAQLTENLRASDDFSFKLLGLVPLSTLLAFVGVFLKEEVSWSPAYYGFGLLGAVLVWGIFRWELRNIQRCLWYCKVLDKMEQEADNAISAFKIYKKPRFLGIPMGKTESEKLIYSVLIIAWLTFPLMVKSLSSEKCGSAETGWDIGYFICAGLIAVGTAITWFSKLKRQD